MTPGAASSSLTNRSDRYATQAALNASGLASAWGASTLIVYSPLECHSASLTSVMHDVHWQIWTRVGGGHGAEASFPFGSGLVGYTLTSAATVHRRDAKVRHKYRVTFR